MSAGKADTDTNLYRPDAELSNENNFVGSLHEKKNQTSFLSSERKRGCTHGP